MQIISNIDNIQTNTESGSFPFLIVESNNKKYQVKLPNYMTSSMINEYLAHQIANNLSCLVPHGVFIKFESSDIEDSIENILASTKYKQLYIDYDIELIKNKNKEIILFGIEWIKDNSIHAEDKNEFIEYVNYSKNNAFYSLYSYDLYLHNHDRHLKNLLFYQNKDGSHIVMLIDHDKIFGSNGGIDRLSELENDFDCIKNGLNGYLYEYITTNEQKSLILNYSYEIENLKDSKIDDIFINYLTNCNHDILKSDSVKESIKKFLIQRKSKIVNACIAHEGNCYG